MRQPIHPRSRSRHPRRAGASLRWRVVHLGELCLVAAGASVGGALVEYLLDPDRGHSRRARLSDELQADARSALRRRRRQAFRLLHQVADARIGMLRARRLHSKGEREEFDDVTIAQKVRSEALGPMSADLESRVLVDVANGVVTIRGVAEDVSERRRIAAAVSEVHGVRRVENFLHSSDGAAPNKAAVRNLRSAS